MTKRVYNFSPGPAVLPLPVLEQIQSEMLSLPGMGASVLEISHRSAAFDAILAEAQALLRQLLGVPENYRIVFMQGGAHLQFTTVAQNFLRGAGKTAEYIITGTWGNAALKEAQKEGPTRVVWDGKEHNYSYLPEFGELKLSPEAAYVHMTSNETIQGVQFVGQPDAGSVALVCDSSSDFLSRPIDVARYGLIYACAQKNAGISGVTAVVVRDDLLERVPKNLSASLDYANFAKNDSRPNTPPTFAIYVLMLVGRWIRDTIGGLDQMAAHNERKAKLLYDAIDTSGGFYRPHARTDCRSKMNITFRLPSEDLEKSFVKEAAKLELTELKGHRSVGGIRASIYNAMPMPGVETLAEFMADFAKQSG
ncbi:MAG TPA: 3-phosphoserine/phosphohydroxythreonine transaminase [Pirellulales bacterium]|nr:3-phosphoserine/phosphohydroxythreonine transaminase [Pirellulales bacterium]